MRSILAGIAIFSATLLTGAAQAQESDLITYCKSDIERLCKGVPMGDGRLMACLKSHSEEMSVGCAQALKKLKAKEQ